MGRAAWLGAFICFVVLTVVFFQNAWVSDDSQITFRSIDQLFAGSGPRWNPHERVQVFTHPLWFLLLAGLHIFVGDLVLAATMLSFAATAAALFIAGRALGSPLDRDRDRLVRWGCGLAAFLSSRALVDYSSSGLETALVYLLLALLFALGPRPRPLALWLTVSVLLLTRADLAPLVLPLAVFVAWRDRHRAGTVLLGLVPLALWTAFSVVYYGFPLPNPAYAKLSHGIPSTELAAQGLRYLLHAVRWDPITVIFIGAGIVVGLGRASPIGRSLGIGIALELFYVISVGGDFMAGRFLAPLAWLGLLAVLATLPVLTGRGVLVWSLLLGGYQLLAPWPPARTTVAPSVRPAWRAAQWWGIADERGHQYGRYGLVPYLARGGLTDDVDRWQKTVIDSRISILFAIGHGGWTSPLNHIVIDPLGLADPLLARLPSRRPWRVGHYTRSLPAGYVESIQTGENRFVDRGLASFYDDLRLVTSGRLWTLPRWRAIARVNLRPPRFHCTDPQCDGPLVVEKP